MDSHKWVRFLGNNFVINDINNFKNGKTNNTVITLNDTAKIDSHNTLSTHICSNIQSYKRYVINQNNVANKLKKK